MIEVFSYTSSSNQVKKIGLKNLGRKPTWVRIVSLDPKKIKEVSKSIGIPLEELQESLEEEERPKVSVREYMEIIYRAPYVIENEIETLPIYFYLKKNKLITIEKKPLKIFDTLSQNFSNNKNKFLFREGFPYFIYHVIDKINDDFLERIDRIAARIDIYENFSKKDLAVGDIEKLYDQSVVLSFFNQALIADAEVLNLLRKSYFPLIPKKDNVLFEELHHDVLQVIDTEKIQREVIANLMNVHSILTSTRLNEFMKRLTIIALILAIPTILSGLFGMNFTHTPLKNHDY